MKAIKITPTEYIIIETKMNFPKKTFFLRPEQIVSVCFDQSTILIKLLLDNDLNISFNNKGDRLTLETRNEYYRIKEEIEAVIGIDNIPSIEPPDNAKIFPIHLNSKVRSANYEHLTTVYIDKNDIDRIEIKDKLKLIVHIEFDIPISLTFADEIEFKKYKDYLDGTPNDLNTIGAPRSV